jgi:subtilisin
VLYKEGSTGVCQECIEKAGGKVLGALPLINGVLCTMPHEVGVAEVRRHQAVHLVEDDIRVRIVPAYRVRIRAATTATANSWGQKRIGADQVWDYATGDGIKVAVLDTGVDLTHPALKANLERGLNVLDPNSSPIDDNGHGTHVAGIIAGVHDGRGVDGVAPKARIYPVKVFDSNGEGNLSDIVQGLTWCVNNGVEVANMSFGTTSTSEVMRRAISAAASAGLIMVAAAGNDGPGNPVNYPARYSEVIAVGAIDQNDALADFSCTGPEVDVVAPGVDIYSTWMRHGYRTASGTSMATPFVAGAMALYLGQARDSRARKSSASDELQATAQALPSLSREEQGSGLVYVPELVPKPRSSMARGLRFGPRPFLRTAARTSRKSAN